MRFIAVHSDNCRKTAFVPLTKILPCGALKAGMKKNKNYNKAFGIALREARLRCGKTQEALALDAEIDRTYISLLELGQRSPTLDAIAALCDSLNISLPEFTLRMQEILDSNIDD
jgi:DNA-binding XRE family transcriptional regulator